MIRYCPLPSVTAVRTFSIRTGLDASTVTPGRTAPEASRTTPAMVACARAAAGAATSARTKTMHRTVTRRISRLLIPMFPAYPLGCPPRPRLPPTLPAAHLPPRLQLVDDRLEAPALRRLREHVPVAADVPCVVGVEVLPLQRGVDEIRRAGRAAAISARFDDEVH